MEIFTESENKDIQIGPKIGKGSQQSYHDHLKSTKVYYALMDFMI